MYPPKEEIKKNKTLPGSEEVIQQQERCYNDQCPLAGEIKGPFVHFVMKGRATVISHPWEVCHPGQVYQPSA